MYFYLSGKIELYKVSVKINAFDDSKLNLISDSIWMINNSCYKYTKRWQEAHKWSFKTERENVMLENTITYTIAVYKHIKHICSD